MLTVLHTLLTCHMSLSTCNMSLLACRIINNLSHDFMSLERLLVPGVSIKAIEVCAYVFLFDNYSILLLLVKR